MDVLFSPLLSKEEENRFCNGGISYLRYLIQYNQTYWINVYGFVISCI